MNQEPMNGEVRRLLSEVLRLAIICESGPLRCKIQINGVTKLQGVFTMRDQEGFPVDMSYEIAKEHGWEVDWVEALTDAARQCILKYDALLEEIRMLEPHKVDAATKIFMCGLMSCEGATFCDKAAHLYKWMRESHLPTMRTQANQRLYEQIQDAQVGFTASG